MAKALDFPILQETVLNVRLFYCSAWLYPEACVNLLAEQMSDISVPFGSPLKIKCSIVKIYQIHESKFASCREVTIISVVYFGFSFSTFLVTLVLGIAIGSLGAWIGEL